MRAPALIFNSRIRSSEGAGSRFFVRAGTG